MTVPSIWFIFQLPNYSSLGLESRFPLHPASTQGRHIMSVPCFSLVSFNVEQTWWFFSTFCLLWHWYFQRVQAIFFGRLSHGISFSIFSWFRFRLNVFRKNSLQCFLLSSPPERTCQFVALLVTWWMVMGQLFVPESQGTFALSFTSKEVVTVWDHVDILFHPWF